MLDSYQPIHQPNSHNTMANTYINEYTTLSRVVAELKGIMEREHKRHMMDCHLNFSTHDVIEEVITMLEDEVDYQPSDAELTGEPAMTASELHTQAWKQHQELHS